MIYISKELQEWVVGDIVRIYNKKDLSISFFRWSLRQAWIQLKAQLIRPVSRLFDLRVVTGWDGKHKKMATKVSLITEENGLPLDVEFGKGSRHDLKFVEKHRVNLRGRRIKTLNADKGYTSIELRRNLRRSGIHINMETRVGDYRHKRGPMFKFDEEKYKGRFSVERLNGWLKGFRSLRLRRSFKIGMFKALVYLALIVILLRNIEFWNGFVVKFR